MTNITLQMHNWHIEDKTPYISIGKAGENNAVTIFLKGDDLIYTDPEADRYVDYFLDICDENDILSANTQQFDQSEDSEGRVILSASLLREFIGKEGVKLLQVRCVVTNTLGVEVGTYESNAIHAIVKRNSGFGYKYDLAYFQQMINNIRLTIETAISSTMQNIMNKDVYDTNLNGIVDNAEKVQYPLVIFNGDDELQYDGSQQIVIDISGSGGGGGGGGTTNYNMLNHKPSINGNTLEGNKTNAQLGIPTKTSDLSNDSGFVNSDDVYLKTQIYNKTEVDIKLNLKANKAELATVATSGSYNDLSDKPTLSDVAISGSYNDLLNIPTFATVATSGNYNDLSHKPNLANVATTGNYNDLSNKPSLSNVATSGDYDDLINKPTLATVATTGQYADLKNTPTLATVATSGEYSDLKNKPTFADVAFSGSYNDLVDTPQLEMVTGVKGSEETTYRKGNVNITKANIGLSDVPNVSTNNQIVTYTDASTLETLASGEKMSVAFAKIKKAISSLIAHIANTNNPHNVTASQLSLATVATSGSYADLTNKPTINGTTVTGALTSANLKVQDVMQLTTMPTATATYAGKVYQYVGTTDANFTKGYFYTSVQNGLVYEWVAVDTQSRDTTSTHVRQDELRITSAQLDASGSPISLQPRTLYTVTDNLGEAGGVSRIAIHRAGTSISYFDEWHIMFGITDASLVQFEFDSGLKFPDDFSIQSNSVYEISILGDFVAYQRWSTT